MDTNLGQRPTIGYLAPTIQNSTVMAFWTGIVDVAQQHDLNLLCMVGGRVHDNSGFAGQENIYGDFLKLVYTSDLVTAESWRDSGTLDGALVRGRRTLPDRADPPQTPAIPDRLP